MSVTKQMPLTTGLPDKPEPHQILSGVDLSGKVAVVTGGYSGIGLETVQALSNAGARIVVPARRPDDARTALSSVRGDVTVAAMDLADINSVQKFTADFCDAEHELALLINNAGIMACPETRIGQGWEAQFATNHLGHYELFNGLLAPLRAAAGARVVALSSTAHLRSDILWDDIHFGTTPYEKWTAYAQSKTANALFAVGADKRFADDGIRVFAAHPGGILTPLQRHLQKAEMIALGWIDDDGEIPDAARPFFKTPAQGAGTTLWCATSGLLNGNGGVYCEDCNIAAPQHAEGRVFKGVRPYAVDDAAADRLWTLTAAMLA